MLSFATKGILTNTLPWEAKHYFLFLLPAWWRIQLQHKKVNVQPVHVEAPFPMDSVHLCTFPNKEFSITKYGAQKGSNHLNTLAFAKAIEACHRAGGGRVVVPAGEWFTGPIHLKSHVNLFLEEGAVVRFSDNPNDYLPAVMTSWEGLECYNYSPLIYAFECENVGISGKGTLAPVMGTWRTWFKRPEAHLNALRQLYSMGVNRCSCRTTPNGKRRKIIFVHTSFILTAAKIYY